MKTTQAFLLIIVLLFCTISCYRIYTLDVFYFEPETVDEYFQPEDIEDWYHIRWVIPDSLIEPVVLDAKGNDVYGFFVKAPDTIINPVTIIFSNGKDKNINRYWGWVEILWECGYNVFNYDYEGYGKSEGSPSDEACFRDKRKAVDYVRARNDLDLSRIVYMGLSMGTYVTVYGAADYVKPALVILESPPASSTALLKDSYLLDLPGSYVLDAADFDSEKRIANIGAPLFLMAGEDDDFVVFERNGEILFAKAKEPKELWLVHGATHTDIKEVVSYDVYRQKISDFVNTYLP